MSNHPKYVIDSIVKTISIRVSNLSANENIFNKHAPVYNNALRLSGFKDDLYIPNTRFKNSLAGLPPDSEVTDYPKFVSPSAHRRSGNYFSTTSTENDDHRNRANRDQMVVPRSQVRGDGTLFSLPPPHRFFTEKSALSRLFATGLL